MDNKREIPIWFFIGSLLTVYGVLILGTGIYHLFVPPPKASGWSTTGRTRRRGFPSTRRPGL